MDTLLTTQEKVAETVLAYYRLADDLLPTRREMSAWFAQLPAASQHEAALLPRAQWFMLPACRRFLLERRGYNMRAYMHRWLSAQELPYWLDDDDGGVRPA